jgi:hypothetical protein
MADDTQTTGQGEHGAVHDDHHGIHLPPNSWSPLILAVALTAVLTGLIVGWWLTGAGAVLFVTTLAIWLKSAREEYLGLPD